jgi:RES domain-containing protein
MKVYRASRRPQSAFDPLDASSSVARDGWRFNDRKHPILYTAEVQSLAIIEVVDLVDLALTLPSNWNVRPAAANAQRLGAEFLEAVDKAEAAGRRICGLRVPSVISSVDHNVLLDPRQVAEYTIDSWARIPFERLVSPPTAARPGGVGRELPQPGSASPGLLSLPAPCTTRWGKGISMPWRSKACHTAWFTSLQMPLLSIGLAIQKRRAYSTAESP